MIEIKNVCKTYKNASNENLVLNNINLELDSCGIVSIFGKSGCGKTTLLNLIAGLDKPTKGEVLIDGKKVDDEYRLEKIGCIFQDYVLVENLTVEENIRIIDKSITDEYLNDTLKSLHIENLKERKVSHLSGGEKQRVSIARAIIKKPRFIICDEPTGNLDSQNKSIVMEILKTLSKHYLIILVSHDKEIVEKYSDKIIFLENAEIQKIVIKNESVKIDDNEKDNKNQIKFKMNPVSFEFKTKTNFITIILVMAICILSFIFASKVTDNTAILNKIPNNYIRLNEKLGYDEFYEINKTAIFTNIVSRRIRIDGNSDKILFSCSDFVVKDDEDVYMLPTSYAKEKIELTETECAISSNLAKLIYDKAVDENSIKLQIVGIKDINDLIGLSLVIDPHDTKIQIKSIFEGNDNIAYFNDKFLISDVIMDRYPLFPSYSSSNGMSINEYNKINGTTFKEDKIIYVDNDYRYLISNKSGKEQDKIVINNVQYNYKVVELNGVSFLIDDYLKYLNSVNDIIIDKDINNIEELLYNSNVDFYSYHNFYQQSINESYQILFNILCTIILIIFVISCFFFGVDLSRFFADNIELFVVLRCLGVSKKSIIKNNVINQFLKSSINIFIGIILSILLSLYLGKINDMSRLSFLINPLTILLGFIISALVILILQVLNNAFRLKDTAAVLKQKNKA